MIVRLVSQECPSWCEQDDRRRVLCEDCFTCVSNVSRNALGKIEDLYRKLHKDKDNKRLCLFREDEQGLFLRADDTF